MKLLRIYLSFIKSESSQLSYNTIFSVERPQLSHYQSVVNQHQNRKSFE